MNQVDTRIHFVHYNLEDGSIKTICTLHYAEIGASFNNRRFGLLLLGVVLIILISSVENSKYYEFFA